MFDTVIYHGNCPDGFTGAWVFWRRWGDTLEYLPYRYEEKIPDLTGKRVVIVDFSFHRAELTRICDVAEYVVLLDHHKTAQRNLQGLNLDNLEIVFDMQRSGAQIAWDYLYPELEYPWFVNYVADRDLWKNALPNTKEIGTVLSSEGYFRDFSKLSSLLDKSSEDFVQRGKLLLEFKNGQVEYYASQSTVALIHLCGEDYRVRIVGCPRMYRSDVGSLIATSQECDFAVVYWYDFKSREWWVSARAREDSHLDLTELLAEVGGGGHPKASGFTIHGVKGETLETYFRPLS